ncbi:MAG TPA: carbonic anhydrase [Acidimicrobiales bacterium]|nr:carbonic anhydrase [Acidimicrobiales bacterium]
MFDELLAANAGYASRFTHDGMEARAVKAFCVLTCMDTRIDPLSILGLSVGDAKILRNAGGRVTPDVLRSMVLAATFLGVKEIAVMHHTKCALAGTDDASVPDAMSQQQRDATNGWSWLSMPDPDVALVDDVEAVRSCRGLPPGTTVEGWRYDVETGLVARLIPA